MSLAEIITIGDELLIGQVVDTNSAWIGQKLNEIGIKVHQITSVSDDESHIIAALNDARQRADVVLITGGLGPTKDDITKNTLVKYFNTKLRFDQEAFENVERIFKARGKEVSEINRKQAEVPDNCEVIPNAMGTAPGMWMEVSRESGVVSRGRNKESRESGVVSGDGKAVSQLPTTNSLLIFVSMPGVPYEMKAMMENTILPKLHQRFNSKAIFHKTVLTQGIGESSLSDIIEQWELNLPKHIKLAYLPSPGLVRLRLSAMGTNKDALHEEVNEQIEKLKALAGEYIYGYDSDSLEKIVGQLLIEHKATLSTAESCTGGHIAHRITAVSGSSEYYIGSVVAYANRVKEEFLSVPAGTIKKYGAVSKKVVVKMATECKEKFKTDYAIAVSGIAGPSGGSELKPVGTVWLAIAHPGGVFSKKLLLGTVRERIIIETTQHALNNLRKILTGEITVEPENASIDTEDKIV